jgi:peroxiredoxin
LHKSSCMYRICLFLLLPVFSLAQNNFTLKGNLKLSKPVDWVYLRYSANDNTVVDSLQPKDGEFTFRGEIEEPTLASLMIKYRTTGDEKPQRDGVPVFLTEGKMTLSATDSLKNNTVTGSPAHVAFSQIEERAKPYQEREKPLYDQYTAARKQGDKQTMKSIEKQIDAIDSEMTERVYGDYFKANPASPIAVWALRQYAGYEVNAAKIEPLYARLPASVQKHKMAVALKEEIDVAKKTGIGQYAMDFSQDDTLGHPMALSSLKGKYVLVDFWASWCGPCRQENPNVVTVFNKYKGKNFTILSVSLDRPGQKERWLKAIHDDHLEWNHVSDLKFWDNAVAKQYGIRAIPQNLLLDPQGKIIAKNLRGDDLAQKLGDLFGDGVASK